MQPFSPKGSLYALVPLFVFIIIYLSASIALDDFYKVPVLVAFLLASVVGLLQYPQRSFEEKLGAFCSGAGNPMIMLMILVFLLAGMFASLASYIGAIDTIVHWSLSFVSPRLFVAGLFLIAAFISLSIGTSVGTILALAPIAVGLNENVEGTLAISLAAVTGGAMFGDNLSFISDTTIAAARTQEISMRDKFKVNFSIVIGPALLSFLLYAFTGDFMSEVPPEGQHHWISIVPYLLVFVMALSGFNVVWALLSGIVAATGIALFVNEAPLWDVVTEANKGMTSMFQLSIICVMIGGMVGLIRHHGGITFILDQARRVISSARGAELGIATLTALINAAIANNTITIIITGPIAREIADRYHLDRRRSASIMDTISCTVQGMLPYGAQLLAALSIASYQVKPSAVISHMYYPLMVGVATLLVILLGQYKLPILGIGISKKKKR